MCPPARGQRGFEQTSQKACCRRIPISTSEGNPGPRSQDRNTERTLQPEAQGRGSEETWGPATVSEPQGTKGQPSWWNHSAPRRKEHLQCADPEQRQDFPLGGTKPVPSQDILQVRRQKLSSSLPEGTIISTRHGIKPRSC